MNAKILLVDDSKTNLELIKMVLEEEGYYIVTAGSATEALRKLKRDEFDLVLTDFLMPPGKNGILLTQDIKKKSPQTEVMIITAYGDVDNAVKAIKLGAFDFLQRPINNDILLLKVKNALEKRMLSSQLQKVQKVFKEELELKYQIVGNSMMIRNLAESLKVIATTDSTVLITGEAGVGKELFARTIHNLSNRRDKNFFVVKCGAVPPILLEEELFGNAENKGKGSILEQARGGTVFLDEIAEISPPIQIKILRLLQSGEAGNANINQDSKNIRIITASNQKLREAVARGKFRKDLFYKLNVITLKVPPLRERKEDIPLLSNYFLAKYAEKYDKDIKEISNASMRFLISYTWPGNVRELENVIERAVILSKESEIVPTSLSEEVLGAKEEKTEGFLTYKKAKENFDREYLTQVLEYSSGNVQQAAKIAKKHRTDLYDMIRKYKVDVNSFRKKGGNENEI